MIDWNAFLCALIGAFLGTTGGGSVRTWWQTRRERRSVQDLDKALEKFRAEWERIYGSGGGRSEEQR